MAADAADEDLVLASRERRRLELARVQLRKRFEEAKIEEAHKDLEHEVAAAQRASDEGVRLLEELAPYAQRIAEGAARLQVISDKIKQSYAASNKLGVPKVVQPDRIVRGVGNSPSRVDFADALNIPDPRNYERCLWPARDPAREAEVNAFKREYLKAV